MSLDEYNKKRNFDQTTEPIGSIGKSNQKLKFVVQRHSASRLHYDFRLEIGGVLVSWAVPKGPSMNPEDRRLAMHVEDHPLSYANFEGEIPKGNYGAGMVEIWDEGWYEPESKSTVNDEVDMQAQLQEGSIKITLHGKKLKGGFGLFKTTGKEENAWLLVKHKDQFVVKPYNSEDYVEADSIVSAYIAAKKSKKKPKPQFVKSVAEIPLPERKLGGKLKQFISPMLATTRDDAFDSEDYIYEIKWDGYRAIADLRQDVLLYSRNGNLFTYDFAKILSDLRQQPHQMILDGELVAYDEQGKPSFQGLQNIQNQVVAVKYQVFDLLWLNGHSTINLTLLERKELLEQALLETENIQYHDHVEDDGISFFEQIKSMELEGMMAKKKSSVYAIGKRSESWLKIKNLQTQQVFICGYTAPKGEREFFGSLIIGCENDKKVEFCGHVGTGFDDATLEYLHDIMQNYVQEDCPFDEVPKTNAEPTWLEPKLVAEIKFTEKTGDGIFRHPVYLGLRLDLMENDLEISPKVQHRKIPFPISNPDKIYFPESGISKLQVAEYYYNIASYILPHLKNRPQSMVRFPEGIHGMNFYQKDAPEHINAEVLTTKIYSESSERYIDYIICNDSKTMAYMNNLGCIDFHMWPSTIYNLDHPDYAMLDLDPSNKNSFAQLREVALCIKSILDKMKIEGFCKTSGSKGLHIYLPLAGKYTYEQARDFAHLIMKKVMEMLPKLTTLERSLDKRNGKIYLDYLQNRKGQTLASVYSLRPKIDATVSMPLEWTELQSNIVAKDFNIFNAVERIRNKKDIFAPVLRDGIDILNVISNL